MPKKARIECCINCGRDIEVKVFVLKNVTLCSMCDTDYDTLISHTSDSKELLITSWPNGYDKIKQESAELNIYGIGSLDYFRNEYQEEGYINERESFTNKIILHKIDF